MSNETVKLISYPDSDIQALAMLYTKNQDLKGKSVIEIASVYYDAYYELLHAHRDLRSNARSKHNKN